MRCEAVLQHVPGVELGHRRVAKVDWRDSNVGTGLIDQPEQELPFREVPLGYGDQVPLGWGSDVRRGTVASDAGAGDYQG